MIQNLKRSNLLSIGLAAKGTSVICCILVSCYFLFSILTNTFMVPASNFVGNIPSVLRGEFSYIITGPLYHFEWNHLMWNLLPTVVLGPFIEWKIGSVALVIGFFTSGWIGALIFCFGFGGYIQSALGISIYICLFYGASISVYALFPMSVFAFLIKKPDFSLITKAILTVAFFTLILVAGDLGCGFWPNFSHFIVDLIMQATLFDHNRNWYRKKLKEEVDICQCNRAIHRYHQGLSRSGVH